MNILRICAPSSVRTGMFCKFGSVEESRPVVRRRVIGPLSTPEEVRQQEQLLDDVLAAVSTTADRHPELRADEAYSRLFGTSDCCEQMLRTSRLLYNDAVTRLDRAVRSFPTSWAARLCGVKRRQHWEA